MNVKKYILIAVSSIVVVTGTYWLGFYPVSELGYKWRVGEVNTYNYEFLANGVGESLGSLSKGVSAPPIMDTSVSTRMAGSLDITTLSIDEETQHVRLLYRMSPDVFEMKVGAVSAPKLPGYINMIVMLNEQGQVINFELPQDIYMILNSTLAELISLIELPLPPENKITWRGLEKSFSDIIPVEMSRLWQLPFLGLQPVAKNYFSSQKGNVHSGTMIYDLESEKGLLKNITGVRISEYRIAGRAVSKTQTQFSLHHIQTSQKSTSQLSFNGFNNIKTVKDNLQGIYFERHARLQSKKNVLGSDTLESLSILMKEIDLSSRQTRTPLMQKLYALMLLHPETVASIGEWLTQYDVTDNEFRMIVALLSGLGTSEAQSILVDTMQNSADGREILQILPNMGLLKKPTLESENYIRSLKASSSGKMVENMADLSLGAMAKNLASQYPERAKRILQDKEQELSAATTEDDLKYQLRVVGNMGLDDQYEIVEPYLNSESNEVRAQAVDSLRFVATEDAANTLIKSMADDDINVRKAAVGALSYRSASDKLINAYENRLYKEKKESVVSGILSNIGGISKNNSRRNELLSDYAKRCGITSLCDQAKSLL